MAAKCIILLFLPLGFFHVAQSANVINIIAIQTGEIVNGNVTLRASVTYSLTNPGVRNSVTCMHDVYIMFVLPFMIVAVQN